MNRNFSKKQIITIALLVAVAAVLSVLILTTSNSQPGQQGESLEQANAKEPVKGPKGGKYFAQDGYGVEVTIFEDGVDPEFRIYTYKDDTLLPPRGHKGQHCA